MPTARFWTLTDTHRNIYIYICTEDTAVLFSTNYSLLAVAYAEMIYGALSISPIHVQGSIKRDRRKSCSYSSNDCIAYNEEIQFSCQLFLWEHTLGGKASHEMYAVNRAQIIRDTMIWHCCSFPV